MGALVLLEEGQKQGQGEVVGRLVSGAIPGTVGWAGASSGWMSDVISYDGAGLGCLVSVSSPELGEWREALKG